MKKIINRKEYYIPNNLTSEQEKIYCHIIDWKQANVTTQRGEYKGNEYDAIFPENSSIPAMIYKPIIPQLEDMQQSLFAYKPHKFANHAVSSQTACINLFLPVLMSSKANDILAKIPGCPTNFKEIARNHLYNGFCFEYWGQDIKHDKGLLNDHSAQAGTDADVAIAYFNKNDELCLWLIEHKLSEKEFTECGAYKSKANTLKENCKECNLTLLSCMPQKCYYHSKEYKYWHFFNRHKKDFHEEINIVGCPFVSGLNQLWRNQVLGYALQDSGVYHAVTFSVCHHAKNTMLEHSIKLYKGLICNKLIFSSFTNYDIVEAIDTNNSELDLWKKWYKEVYCF